MAKGTVREPTTNERGTRTPARAARAVTGKQQTSAKPRKAAHASKRAYDVAVVEAKWRAEWEQRGLYRPDLERARNPYYNLMMFPYPSAEGLHVGNMYSYIGSDVHGRWQAMRGYDVFEPMGFDAFGIHSENFAIKEGKHPKALTASNIANFRAQLQRIGNRFDWSHEISSTDPEYYRWTQWIFVQLFKAGLAERKKGAVNWCPNDKTVLADEQVIDGHCERCGAIVERRELEQWYFKITKYADQLLDNLDWLDWSERVKAAQRHWIGRSTGVEFAMRIAGHPETRVRVYTTRPDTIFGVTFVALAPEHPAVAQIADAAHREAVAAYVAAARRAPASTQEGVERPVTGVFTGAYAIHPLTGEQVPVWVSDYVLMEYGTGAIMAVPAHDARDWAFARAMGLPVRQVVRSASVSDDAEMAGDEAQEAFTDVGVLVNSGAYTGQTSAEASEAIAAEMEARGIGVRSVKYHLRDWLISRQRYWGPPIPIIYCPDHGAVPVPEDQLPVVLPYVEDYRPTGTGISPLAADGEFVNTTCPICGKAARRETDVSDNFLDSAWYFLRYPSSDDEREPWNPELTRKWLPAKMYVGGAEHSVLHLLYVRFITMALHDLGYLDFAEPFPRFRANGMMTVNGMKISKSRPETYISPDGYIAQHGADAFRTYLMFMGPYESGGDFTDRGLGGVTRFLDRVWQLVTAHAATAPKHAPTGEARRIQHATIQRVTVDTEALKYNTAIAALMKYLNGLERAEQVTRAESETLLLLLAPFAPFVTDELWHRLGHRSSIHTQRWPEVDASALRAETLTIIVQVNGRMRDRVEVAAEATEAEVTQMARDAEKARRAIGDAPIRQVIYVPERLVNIVTA
ncbi:MAG: Leucyl-tRNA synthetase [Ktedonobacterales bacterium]|jgi:leucyl-tRNA synthetase|nr:MAG: Leucyl-tRNA synthetase [Ktedonobacterales bacterium]